MFTPFSYFGTTSLPADESFFTAVANAGGSLTSTEETAITDLVDDLQSAGLFGLLDAFYPFVGSSASSCAINLINPKIHTISFTGGWSFSSAGITQTSAGEADLRLQNNLRSGSVYSHGVFVSNNTTGTQCITNPTGGSYLVPRQTSTNDALASFDNNVNVLGTGITDSTGWWIATNDLSTTALYKNNTLLGSVSETRTANGANYGFGGFDFLLSVAHFGAVESLTDRTALYNAITSFNTTLSR